MKLKTSILSVILMSSIFTIYADEGMWIPALLQKYNEDSMFKKGLKISAGDIYSINHASLKDAIVLFGRGCTGEVVSDQGLLLTNHHCGYGQIQSHSTIENDLLTKGFWAMSKIQELNCPGLTVSFLIRMEDVTAAALKGVKPEMNETERAILIDNNSKIIIENAIMSTRYTAVVKPLYYGNQYFLYVMEVFRDVRLAGAPPSDIGKFGGDTDNWEWPRHTGDFCVFRIYANKNNEPADYSPGNIPYKPKKHLVISLKGIKENDFTMVYGYPYSTQEYLPSFAVKLIYETEYPVRIMARTKKLDIIGNEMKNNPVVRIKYFAKQGGIANGWKKWMGEENGIERTNVIGKKKELENEVVQWLNNSKELHAKYGDLISEYEKYYNQMTPLELWNDYFEETIWNDDLAGFTFRFEQLENTDIKDTAKINKIIKSIRAGTKTFFKDFDPGTEKKIFPAMLSVFCKGIDIKQYPGFLLNNYKKYNGNITEYCSILFSKTFMADENKVYHFLESWSASKKKILTNDPVYSLMKSFVNYYISNYSGKIKYCILKIDSLNRLYMAALMEMQANKLFYPDANGTLRLAYGKIQSYKPKDAVEYNWYTTLDGVIEKENPDIQDYHVPDKLKELYRNKDYGRYGANNTVPVAFIASNHTSGGNSGSPVLNSEGQLIGINFDRDREGTMSDIIFDPDQCRNISLDIRYCLFIIDKFAGARNLVDEMEIVQ